MIDIKVGKKGKIQNEILFVFDDTKDIDKIVSEFIKTEMKFEKDQKFVVKVLQKNGGKNFDIIVRLKSPKDFIENLEDVVVGIMSNIKAYKKDVFLDIDGSGLAKLSDEQKRLIVDFFVLAGYSFDKYKSKKTDDLSITINCSYKNFDVFKESLNLVRDLVNEPADAVNPDTYEDIVKGLFKGVKNVNIQVIAGDELLKQGLNGIYTVGKGSEKKPKFIVISYLPKPKQAIEYALIGKGVCFDSGGYNIKPTGSMEDMKSDMAGSAVVLGVLNYLSKIGYDKNVVVGMPLVENLVSGRAYKPGDIIKMYNGKTVEIGNTDAEGRLILADALAFVEKNYKPKYMFDIATLTGAQIIALGSRICAIVGKNNILNQKIQKLSWDIKERAWELPCFMPYFKNYKSHIADFGNVGKSRDAGTITAGLFLSQFVEMKDWVHFDIAGPSGIFGGNDELLESGATGFGFRLFINIIEKL